MDGTAHAIASDTARGFGVVRAVADLDNVNAEFAIIIRFDLKGFGLGQMLMAKLIAYLHQRGTQALVGEALSENHALIELTKNLGFDLHSQAGTGTVELRLTLQ